MSASATRWCREKEKAGKSHDITIACWVRVKMAVFSIGFIIALLTTPNWIFLTAFNEFQPGDNQRSGYFHIIEGFSLFDHILSTHYTESSLICGFLCLRNEHCISFNFGRGISSYGKFPCELSSSNASQFPMDLKRRSAFDYFSFLVSQ